MSRPGRALVIVPDRKRTLIGLIQRGVISALIALVVYYGEPNDRSLQTVADAAVSPENSKCHQLDVAL